MAITKGIFLLATMREKPLGVRSLMTLQEDLAIADNDHYNHEREKRKIQSATAGTGYLGVHIYILNDLVGLAIGCVLIALFGRLSTGPDKPHCLSLDRYS